ncbi:DUF1214 domain-containing protein [Actinoplanes sp. NPDC024001]|uniref:DUF1214 domain-containing protein n=1 Tax=Actinoplanes sp. NPDC024001 TaxID=3154598 RepID=UPI00340284C4
MTDFVDQRFLTPDEVPSPIGVLRFQDGVIDSRSANAVFDHLLYLRGVDAFLAAYRHVSVRCLINGLREFGVADHDVLLFSELIDSASLFLTANCDTVYAWSILDLSQGPVAVTVPENVIVVFDDARFEWVGDAGNPGPDRGQGGRYLVHRDDYDGPMPEGGYFVYSAPTNNVIMLCRAFVEGADPASAVERVRDGLRIGAYRPGGFGSSLSRFVTGRGPMAPLEAERVPAFVEGSHQAINTLVPADFSFFELCDQIVQEERVGVFSPEVAGHLAAIGIRRGQPFKPSDHHRRILQQAAAFGNAAARAIAYREPASEQFAYYAGTATWQNPLFVSGYDMLRPPAAITPDGVELAPETGALHLDGRAAMFYLATFITPAMSMRLPGVGSQYLVAYFDAEGDNLDGARTYRLDLPANIPAAAFWSITVYDNQTRSLLVTDQRYPRAGSQPYPTPAATANEDGSTTLWFAPEQPAGALPGTWVQTVPGKGYFLMARFYSPLPSFFDRSWKPGEVIPVAP